MRNYERQRSRWLRQLAALSMASFAVSAVAPVRAAALGKLEITSGLGEPLRGRIEVLGATRHELDTLGARLASEQTYGQAGIAYSPSLQPLKFRLAKRKGGGHYISVTSSRPFGEPIADLVVELAWFGGTRSYAYTALVDPTTSESSPAASAPTPLPQASTVLATTRRAVVKRNAVAQRRAGDHAYDGRIREQEEQITINKQRLAAAQERISELQHTVAEQEQLLSTMAAQTIEGDMRNRQSATVTRVSQEGKARAAHARPAPQLSAGVFVDPLYLGAGATLALLGTLVFLRKRRRHVGDIDGEYSVEPSLQPA